jgi:heme/copper-type cytochrome/quinol oxidase subunit 2
MRRPGRLVTARVLLGTVALLAAGHTSAWACPVCFRAEETHLIDGARLGILALLAITLVVQGGFVSFFLYLRKRAKQIADLDLDAEWSKFQGGASRS